MCTTKLIKEIPCAIIEEENSYILSFDNTPREIINFLSTEVGGVKMTSSGEGNFNLIFRKKDHN